MLVAGTSIGRYVVKEQIGCGGMGEVYRARDPRLNRDVALKILAPSLTRDEAAIARFEREAIAASALNHPHILHVYDVGQEQLGEERIFFIAMELIDGVTLRAELSRGRDPGRLLGYLIQTAEALAKAHGAGIVHRDLKPENIMITADGYAKVLDFGLAKLTASPAGPLEQETTAVLDPRTSAGVIVGTAGYMAPEQAEGRAVDRRSDVFSFGCVLFELATGKAPFRGRSTIDTLHHVIHAEPDYAGVPSALRPIVRRCLAKNPANRFQTMDEVVGALRQAVQESAEKRPSHVSKTRTKQIESIAVLPFADTSHALESEYLSDGITETLLNSLSLIPKLRVVPRSTVFRYRKRDDINVVAGELGVQAVLTGRVSQRQDRILVAAELTDTERDAQVWGEQYSRPVADLLEVQKAIADDIARQLRPKLSGRTRSRVVAVHTEDPEAYQLYLKGRYNLNKRSADALRKAVEFFQAAIDRDPVYARGYAGLSDGWVLLGWYAIERPRDAFPRALAAARQAVAIDASYAEAHTSVAYATFLAEWDATAAEREFAKAIALNPDYPIAHHWYADLLQATGRAKEAIEQATRACELDPLALILNAELGRAFYYDRAFSRAIEQQQKMLDLEPNFAPSLLFIGQAYDQSGRPGDSVDAFQRGVTVTRGNPIYRGYLGYALARQQSKPVAADMLAELLSEGERQWIPAFAPALIQLGLQRWDDAARSLDAALQERSHWLLYASVDPAFDPLWNDGRFTELRHRIVDAQR